MQQQLLSLAQALQMVTYNMRDHSDSTKETIARLKQMPTSKRLRNTQPILQNSLECTKKEVITVIYDCDGLGDDV